MNRKKKKMMWSQPARDQIIEEREERYYRSWVRSEKKKEKMAAEFAADQQHEREMTQQFGHVPPGGRRVRTPQRFTGVTPTPRVKR